MAAALLTVGVTEAKRRWSELLDRAAAGESIVITRRGKVAARLVPVNRPSARLCPEELLKRVRAFRARVKPNSTSTGG